MVLNVNRVNKHLQIIKLLENHVTRVKFMYDKYKDNRSKKELEDSRELLEYLRELWKKDNK